MNIVDILYHIPADLPAGERDAIERDLQGCDGVLSAHFVAKQPHMLEVAYNPEVIDSSTLRRHVSERGLEVSMIGL